VTAAGGAAVPGPLGFMVAGVVYTAQTGINYRKYKKGLIEYDEFKQRVKKGAFATTGSMIGSTGGLIGGVLAG